MNERKDPAEVRCYSLPQSKHRVLWAIAKKAGHGNRTRALDELLEVAFREEFGRRWRDTYEQALDVDVEVLTA